MSCHQFTLIPTHCCYYQSYLILNLRELILPQLLKVLREILVRQITQRENT